MKGASGIMLNTTQALVSFASEIGKVIPIMQMMKLSSRAFQ